MNFIPKEISKKTINRLLAERQKRSDERSAKMREEILKSVKEE